MSSKLKFFMSFLMLWISINCLRGNEWFDRNTVLMPLYHLIEMTLYDVLSRYVYLCFILSKRHMWFLFFLNMYTFLAKKFPFNSIMVVLHKLKLRKVFSQMTFWDGCFIFDQSFYFILFFFNFYFNLEWFIFICFS